MPEAADSQALSPDARAQLHHLMDTLTVIKARAQITRRLLLRDRSTPPTDLLAHLDQIVERADRAAALLQDPPTPPGTAT